MTKDNVGFVLRFRGEISNGDKNTLPPIFSHLRRDGSCLRGSWKGQDQLAQNMAALRQITAENKTTATVFTDTKGEFTPYGKHTNLEGTLLRLNKNGDLAVMSPQRLSLKEAKRRPRFLPPLNN